MPRLSPAKRLAGLLLFGRSFWPALFLGAFFANLTTAGNVATSLGIAAGNTLEAVLGATLVMRYASGSRAFERAADTFKFVMLAALSSTVSATLGALRAHLADLVAGEHDGQPAGRSAPVALGGPAAAGVEPPVEKELLRRDGCRIPVLVGMVELQGTDLHQLCFVIDVTERRSAQEAMRRAYDELERRVEQRTVELKEEIARRERAEEELRNQAIRDPLTGLYNRRGFKLRTEPQLELAQRGNKALLMFMADLDDLKAINDQFGHAEGDKALVRSAEALRKTGSGSADETGRRPALRAEKNQRRPGLIYCRVTTTL